jgi:hypothetical protein
MSKDIFLVCFHVSGEEMSMHEAKVLVQTELSHDDFNAAFEEGMGALFQKLLSMGVITGAYRGQDEQKGGSNGKV